MLQKTIVQGRLDFGKQRAFDKALKMYRHRLENYYKTEILFKEEEELFDFENLSIVVPRHVAQTTDKYWKNTIDILSYLSQFAVAGKICAWMVEEGNILDYHLIEPDSDKMVVRHFQEGRKLVDKSGQEADAFEALDKAIKKYNKHSQAYERRGHLNYHLKNTEEALHDFSKSIHLDYTNADAHYGRAHVYLRQGSYEKAIDNFEATAKYALALQPIYWKARLHLAECYMKVGKYEKAEFNLKLFTERGFRKTNPNYAKRAHAYSKYGETLIHLDKFDEAAKAFDKAIHCAAEEEAETMLAERLRFRGWAKFQAGRKGYLADWKKAVKLGDDQAEAWLEEHTS
jgi:tetratricopeptide (TPR) repeat protein